MYSPEPAARRRGGIGIEYPIEAGIEEPLDSGSARYDLRFGLHQPRVHHTPWRQMSKAKAAFLFAVPPPLLAGGAALAAIFDEGREVILKNIYLKK